MKKKVLHVSSGGLSPGGVASVIFSIVETLNDEFDFDCVVFNKKSDLEDKYLKFGRLHRINCYPQKGKRDYKELILRATKLYFGIKKVCKLTEYDVIHCHNQHDAWPCLLAAKHCGVPLRISHAHVGTDNRKRFFVEKIIKKLSIRSLNKYANIRIACSKGAGNLLFGTHEFRTIYNSIDLNRFSRSIVTKSSSLRFVHVGRYTYAKNQEFVLRAFACICKTLNDSHLDLVGYGEQHEVDRLSRLIKELKIEDKVDMISGDKVDIKEYYEKANYMIFPSYFEGFGIVLLEAQAMGINCFVSEHIQQEADVGLLTFMNLSDGPEKWAEDIIKYINSNMPKSLDYSKLLEFGSENIAKQYANIYNGMS